MPYTIMQFCEVFGQDEKNLQINISPVRADGEIGET